MIYLVDLLAVFGVSIVIGLLLWLAQDDSPPLPPRLDKYGG